MNLTALPLESPAPTRRSPTPALHRKRRVRRQRLVMAGLALVLAALALATLTLGERTYSPLVVWRVLTGEQVGGAGFVVTELRLPRVVAGTLAGAAFGMVGATFQTLLRNTLASPDVIGVTAGANTAAVVGIVVLGWSGLALTGLAVVGGLLTALAVAGLAWRGGAATSRLVLIGIAVAAMANAATMWVMVRADQFDVAAASRWLTGSLADADPARTVPLAACLTVCAPVLLASSRRLDAAVLGDETATGLGVDVAGTRLLVMTTGVVVLSVATATTGPITFVALLCGPVAAHLCGRATAPLAASGLTGSVLVLASDLVASHALPHVYPVGVVTGVLGGAYLVVALVRTSRKDIP